MTSRAAIELALPARLFLSIAEGKTFSCFDSLGQVTDRAGYDELLAIRAGLTEAIEEALATLPAARRDSARRWLIKANDTAFAALEGEPAAKALRAVLWWLADMLDAGRLDLIEGSTADRAITKLMAWLDDTFDLMRPRERDALDGSARKHARRLATALEAMGYYGDAT